MSAASRSSTSTLQALGGTAQLAKLTSFTAKGHILRVRHRPQGSAGRHLREGAEPADVDHPHARWRQLIAVFDGTQRLVGGPDGAGAARDADERQPRSLPARKRSSRFPRALKQAFNGWKVGRNGDRRSMPVQIVQGTNRRAASREPAISTPSRACWCGCVRWNATPVGPVPTEINYDDYRDVAGVKMPFTWTVSQTYMQMTIKLSSIRRTCRLMRRCSRNRRRRADAITSIQSSAPAVAPREVSCSFAFAALIVRPASASFASSCPGTAA